jgi:hypothetical protein
MPESRVDHLESASERDAQTANHGAQRRRSVIAISQVEDRELRETLQNRFEFDPVVQAAKRVTVLLQPLGDRQVERLDHVARIGLRLRLSHQQKVVRLAIEAWIRISSPVFCNNEITAPGEANNAARIASRALIQINC